MVGRLFTTGIFLSKIPSNVLQCRNRRWGGGEVEFGTVDLNQHLN